MQIPSQKTHMPLIVRALLGFLLVTLSLVGGLLLLMIALMRVMRKTWLRERLRRLNKGRINQFVWLHQQKEAPEKAQGGLT